MTPAVSVVGSGLPDDDLDRDAAHIGRTLAGAGVAVVCGGLGGVMAAVCRGARDAGGLTVGLLPGDARADANPHVDLALPTGLGEARNVLVARAGAAVIAIGGGFGTLSEIAVARKIGTPVIGLRTWRFAEDGIEHVPSAAAAAARAIALATADGGAGGARDRRRPDAS